MKKFVLKSDSSRSSNTLAIVLGLFVLLTIGAPYLPSPQVELPEKIAGVAAIGVQPQMCIGYDELKQNWGQEYGNCPANYAFYGVDDPAGASGPASVITFSKSCCPLPAKDILTSSHSYTIEQCPKNHVATGTKTEINGDRKIEYMRCTKINTKRYQLGDASRGVYWGDGAAGWRGSKRIAWENIPASMRYAQGRKGVDKWDIDGCVGYPWGSLLTKKQTKHCAGFSFRQLQYNGLHPDDPFAGTAVQMIPRCKQVQGIDSLNPECQS